MKLAEIKPRVVRLLGMVELTSTEAQRKAKARHYWRNREKINAGRRKRDASQA